MASTFLGRLKVGPILVDAKGVNRLYRSQTRRSDLFFLFAAALLTIVIIVWNSEPLRVLLKAFWFDLRHSIGG